MSFGELIKRFLLLLLAAWTMFLLPLIAIGSMKVTPDTALLLGFVVSGYFAYKAFTPWGIKLPKGTTIGSAMEVYKEAYRRMLK